MRGFLESAAAGFPMDISGTCFQIAARTQLARSRSEPAVGESEADNIIAVMRGSSDKRGGADAPSYFTTKASVECLVRPGRSLHSSPLARPSLRVHPVRFRQDKQAITHYAAYDLWTGGGKSLEEKKRGKG